MSSYLQEYKQYPVDYAYNMANNLTSPVFRSWLYSLKYEVTETAKIFCPKMSRIPVV